MISLLLAFQSLSSYTSVYIINTSGCRSDAWDRLDSRPGLLMWKKSAQHLSLTEHNGLITVKGHIYAAGCEAIVC
jgi:hypothetical protein